MLTCANCGARMDERKCKLICRCGYFLSCWTTTEPNRQREGVTPEGRPGSIAYRAFGQFHRDARLILVTSLVSGAALSLYWIDFNLYLSSLGFTTATIGIVATLASLAAALVAFPASAASDRVGRRAVFAAGIGVGLLAMIALLASEALPVIVVAAALWTAGSQAMQVVLAPYLTEHSDRSHRNELFAIQFAIQQVTNIIAAVLGGVVAALIARALGLDPDGSGVYRIILVIMALLMAAAMLTVTRLSDDRPRVTADRRVRRLGEPAAFPPDPRRARTWLGIRVHDRGAVREAPDPRAADLDRRRTGDPVPQPLRPAQVRPRPDVRSTPCSH